MLPLCKFNSFAVPICCLHRQIPANPSQCLFVASAVKFLQVQVSAYSPPPLSNSCKSKSVPICHLCRQIPASPSQRSPESLCCMRFPKPPQTLKNSCFYPKTDSHGSCSPHSCRAPSSHRSAPNPGCHSHVGGRTRRPSACSRHFLRTLPNRCTPKT